MLVTEMSKQQASNNKFMNGICCVAMNGLDENICESRHVCLLSQQRVFLLEWKLNEAMTESEKNNKK